MALFKRPSDYSADEPQGGGVAVLAEAPPHSDSTHVGDDISRNPFAEQIAELDREEKEVAKLEGERERLEAARAEALSKVRSQQALLEHMKTPEGLLETSDAALAEAEAQLRHWLRAQGRAERELQLFLGGNTSLAARHERITREREGMDKNVERWAL
jgi:hypothetical protein